MILREPVDIAVDISTGYGLDGPRARIRLPMGARFPPSSDRLNQVAQIGSGCIKNVLVLSQRRQSSMFTGPAQLEPLSDSTANYKPILSSERASYIK
jgi:hypothetical protein